MELYEGLRTESREWGRMPPARGVEPKRAEAPALARFCIGKDDFPEEAISASGVSFLLSTLVRVDSILRTPLPEAKDWLSASVAFFGVLETVFGLPSVGKCRIGFDRLMQALGTEDAVGLVSNCLRRHRTMQREICGAKSASHPAGDPALETSLLELKDQNEAIVKSLDDVRADVVQNAKSVAKLDRRMKESLASFKTMIGGFVRLFRPGQPPTTREKAQAALLPSERYACLAARLEPVAEAPCASVAEGSADHRVERPADRVFEEVPRHFRCIADLVERCARGQCVVLQHGAVAVALRVACLDETIANLIFDSSIHHRIPFGFLLSSPSWRAGQVSGGFRRSYR